MEISYDENGSIVKKEFIKEPITGNDVYLTIDIELQIATEDSLKASVDSLVSSNAGAAISMTPDCEILAVASYPTYDLTRFDSNEYYNSLLNDPANPLYDRAILGLYAPGSTYKIGSAIAAIEYGLITESTEYHCSGRYPHYHNPTCLGVHGDLNVIEAIGVSCNCFFYTVGDKLGIDVITDYTERLGLGVSTGIELPESTGIVAGTDYRASIGSVWNHSENLSAAIGQSDHSYSPTQLAVYISSILNGGERYSAHLLHSVKRFYTDEIIYQYTPNIVDKVDISPSTITTAKNGMRRVITKSQTLTGYFSSIPHAVGGKTGTAQVNGKHDYAVFVGFAPFDDPEIIGVCILEEGLNGGNAALPVRDMFKVYFDVDGSLPEAVG
jgi:penicillin-binding protein 2